jgi:ATP-dependent RNA helicase DeaD
VATDVAARGIDLPDLGLVIHADLPNDRDTLLHRSGRTGRAGRKGTSVLLVPYTRRRKAEGLLASARVDASWGPPPAAEEIRARDQERLVHDPAFAEEPGDEELALAHALLAERSAEQIALALVRMHLARLPAPEEVLRAEPQERVRDRGGPREPRHSRVPDRRASEGVDDGHRRSAEEMVLFRMNVGRRNNADPRWLVPVICRLGHVTKKEIGAIRIGDRETTVEIVKSVAPRFASAVRRASNDDVAIQPASLDPGGERHAHRPNDARPFKGKPPGQRGSAGKPKRP